MPDQEPAQITDQEKKELVGFFEKMDTAMLKATAEAISMMVRAFEGKPVESDDVITRLINIKNKMERSRFPTYPLLSKQVYLRLIAFYNPQAKACEKWADFEAEALIAYKGQNWDAYVDMAKAQSAPQEQQQFYFGNREPQPQLPGEKGKQHWWNKKEKEKDPSEFDSQ